jgi:mono/diheme cytochrome c family protein
MAPALNSPELRARLDDVEIAETITDGRSGTAMPPWKNRLSASQIDALTSFIRNWDQLDKDQLSQLEEQAEYQPGMGGWQGHNSMMGGGCNSGSGMGWHEGHSP